MKVIFASVNAGKVADTQQLLTPVGFELTSLQDFGLAGAEETATTFVENALITVSYTHLTLPTKA